VSQFRAMRFISVENIIADCGGKNRSRLPPTLIRAHYAMSVLSNLVVHVRLIAKDTLFHRATLLHSDIIGRRVESLIARSSRRIDR